MPVSQSKQSFFLILMLWALTSCAAANYIADEHRLYDQYPMSFTYFYGVTVNDPLIHIFEGQLHRWPEDLQSMEVAYTLGTDNWFRKLTHPLVGVAQIAFDFGFRNGPHEHDIFEFNPYLLWHWSNFPWDNYVTTTLGIGEGVSYASSVPSLEKRSNSGTKRLLNYLLLEASIAAPMYPRLALVLRIHHRSGAYGLYHAGNTGSNVVGLGIRCMV